MRHVFTLLLFLTATLLPAAEAPDPDDKARTLASAITEVTVYADRARVTRTAAAELTADVQRVAFRKLPGWIDDGSVRVSLTPPEAGQILDVEVKKTYLARADEVEVRKAENAVTEIADQIAALDDEKKVLDAQSKHVDSVRAFSLDKFPKDVAAREVKPAEYGQVVDFVTESLRKITKAQRNLELTRRDLQPELSARQRKLGELHQRSQLEQRTVFVEIKGAAARAATLSLVYIVPGATWEPAHELRAGADPKSVSLASYAVVSQTTGEDWSGAALSLSTQRTTATLRVPELEALLIGTGRSVARVVSGTADSFQTAQQSYSQQLQTWNFFCNDPETQKIVTMNLMSQSDVQRKVADVFQTLQQRGTTAHFSGGKQTIRSDGRPVRVAIGSATLEAQSRIVAAPEVSLNAARTVDLENMGAQPLLPGKVSLYLEGAFLGSTEADFVAPGESFSLFLGVADQVKLSRVMDRKRSSLERGGKRTKMSLSFLVTAENLSGREIALQLADRIPVSQSEEVKVLNVRIQPEIRADQKGLLRWELALAPKQTREFHIEYTLDYPSDLPQRARVEQEERRKSPAAPATRRDIGEDILDFEKKF